MKPTQDETKTQALILPRGRAYNPWDHADALGITVIERRLTTANELWVPDLNTIFLQSSLRALHKRTALAHGIAHAELGHRDSRPKHEHQADRYSSLYLIEPREFRDIARWARDDRGIICAELGITTRVLDAYLRPA